MAIVYTPIGPGQDFNIVKNLLYKVGEYAIVATGLGSARGLIKIVSSIKKVKRFLDGTTLTDAAVYFLRGTAAYLVTGIKLRQHA